MQKKPRQELAAWFRQQLAGVEEVVLPDLARKAVAARRDDLEFLQAWYDDTIYAVAYGIGVQVCAETRVPRVEHDTPSQPAATEGAPRRRWLDAFEHVGDRYLRLGEMTKADLLRAAEERERPALTELHRVGLMRRLGEKLRGEQRVGEVFTEEQIDRWARLLKVKFTVTIPTPEKLTATSEEAAK